MGRIAFVGLGSMGGDIARRLVSLGQPLAVYDVSAAAREKFSGQAILAGSVAEAGHEAGIIGLCVQNDAQVIECVNELIPVLSGGSVILVHSTIRPETTVALAAQCGAAGIILLDAPVTRVGTPADAPFVLSMLGGDSDTVERVKPYLNAFSVDTIHVGKVGSAMAMKICNNIVSWCGIVLGLEVLDVAESAGVSAEKLIGVMQGNGNLTPAMRAFLGFRMKPQDARRANFATQADVGAKDLALALALAEAGDVDVPVTRTAAALVRERVLELSRLKGERTDS